MTELKPCPCGKTPERLYIVDIGQGSKWANVMGNCCNEWMVEFRAHYKRLSSEECMKLAIEGWNEAHRDTREQAAAQAQLEKDKHSYNLNMERMHDRCAELEEEVEAAQAKIDALMLEYCPDDMTKEQIEEWERHQEPAPSPCVDLAAAEDRVEELEQETSMTRAYCVNFAYFCTDLDKGQCEQAYEVWMKKGFPKAEKPEGGV